MEHRKTGSSEPTHRLNCEVPETLCRSKKLSQRADTTSGGACSTPEVRGWCQARARWTARKAALPASSTKKTTTAQPSGINQPEGPTGAELNQLFMKGR